MVFTEGYFNIHQQRVLGAGGYSVAPSCDAFQANLLTARIPEGVSAQKAANLPHVSSCLGTSDVKPRYVMLKSIELMMF